jgi:hypothetical protein
MSHALFVGVGIAGIVAIVLLLRTAGGKPVGKARYTIAMSLLAVLTVVAIMDMWSRKEFNWFFFLLVGVLFLTGVFWLFGMNVDTAAVTAEAVMGLLFFGLVIAAVVGAFYDHFQSQARARTEQGPHP